MEYVRSYESLSKLVETKRLLPVQAIKYKCLDCCCYQYNEIKLCEDKTCPLWRYRTGKEERDAFYEQSHQGRKPLTDEEKQKRADILKAYRDNS